MCVCARMLRGELSKSNYSDNVLNVCVAAHFHIRGGRDVSCFDNVFGKDACSAKKKTENKKKTSENLTNTHKLKNTHTQMEMRWMQGSKWFLIDAQHPLFHYLQACLIILTFPTLSTVHRAASMKQIKPGAKNSKWPRLRHYGMMVHG